MSVDWLTVAAQLVNFLVLVWLLQHFLYGPITQAMERREKSIEQRLDDASETKKLAQLDAKRLEAERQDLAARREDILAEARSEAEELRRRLEVDVREEMEQLRRDWRRVIEEERETYVADLRRSTVEHFYALARDALGGLANKTLNDSVAEGFADRLLELEPERRRLLREAAGRAGAKAVVESSFPLSAAVRRRVTDAVRQQIQAETAVDYVVTGEMICGVRLRIAGQTIAWSLDGYLDRLEQRVREEMADAYAAPQRTTVQ